MRGLCAKTVKSNYAVLDKSPLENYVTQNRADFRLTAKSVEFRSLTQSLRYYQDLLKLKSIHSNVIIGNGMYMLTYKIMCVKSYTRFYSGSSKAPENIGFATKYRVAGSY